MGTDCAPWLANLTLFAYEFAYLTNSLKKNNVTVYRNLNHCFRYIDDITVINDNGCFNEVYRLIYPSSLVLKKVNEQDGSADVLDINAKIISGEFVCKIFDKRKSFPFQCNVFPSIDSNISSSCIYNVFYGQMFRYFDITSTLQDLRAEICSLLTLLINKGYSRNRLTNTFSKFINNNLNRFAHKFNRSELLNLKAEVNSF